MFTLTLCHLNFSTKLSKIKLTSESDRIRIGIIQRDKLVHYSCFMLRPQNIKTKKPRSSFPERGFDLFKTFGSGLSPEPFYWLGEHCIDGFWHCWNNCGHHYWCYRFICSDDLSESSHYNVLHVLFMQQALNFVLRFYYTPKISFVKGLEKDFSEFLYSPSIVQPYYSPLVSNIYPKF